MMDRRQDLIEGEPGRKPVQGGTVMKANSRAIAGVGVAAPFQIGSYSALSCPVALHLGNAPPFR
jgi:hypothetical protein